MRLMVRIAKNCAVVLCVRVVNGGPGCSSLDGLLYEHGPFLVDHNGTLFPNDYAWNMVSNVIYIESPIGVGYSYSDDGKYVMNDNTTADDLYHGLVEFFTAFTVRSRRVSVRFFCIFLARAFGLCCLVAFAGLQRP